MIETNYLVHYGVKGMKWGVRRYQNKDGSLTTVGKQRAKRNRIIKNRDYKEYQINLEKLDDPRYFNDTILKKGTKVQHISVNKNIEPESNRMFVSVKDIDNDKYTVAMSREMKMLMNAKVYKHWFKTTEDIRIPSKEICVKAFKKIYSEHKDDTIADLDNAIQKLTLNDEWFSQRLMGYKQDIKYDKNYDTGYDLIPTTLGLKYLDPNTKTNSRFFKEISDMGYNAIVDEFDSLSQPMRTDLPIILLDAKKSLKNVSSVPVSNRMYKKASKSNDLNSVYDEIEFYRELYKQLGM